MSSNKLLFDQVIFTENNLYPIVASLFYQNPNYWMANGE